MEIYLSTQIHNSFSVWSSNDIMMGRKAPSDMKLELNPTQRVFDCYHNEWDNDKNVLENIREQIASSLDPNEPCGSILLSRKKLPFYNLHCREGALILQLEDKTHYRAAKLTHGATKEEMETLEKLWRALGFEKKHPGLEAINEADYKNSNLRRAEIRRALNMVWAETPKQIEELKGGLSKEVFQEETLQKYLKTMGQNSGGYVGNENRKAHLDQALEIFLRQFLGWNLPRLAIWLTSTDGRHFCDAYESLEHLVSWGFKNYEGKETEIYHIQKEKRHLCTEELQPYFDAYEASIDRPTLKKAKGHIWWEGKPEPEQRRKGGLSDQIHSLVQKPSPQSYYFHPERTPATDMMLEFILQNGCGKNPQKAAEFIESNPSHALLEFCNNGHSMCRYPRFKNETKPTCKPTN